MESKLKLYYSYDSFYSQKTLIYFYEKQIEFDSYIVDLCAKENLTSWYLNINPRGEVPSAVIGNTVINGSDKILAYLELNSIGKRSLVPLNQKDKEEHELWMKKLSALPIEAITVGTAYFPHTRKFNTAPFNSSVFTRMMIKMHEARCVELCQKSVEYIGTATEKVLVAKAMECEGNNVKYSNEVEHRKVLIQFHKVLDEVEDQLASHFLFGPDENPPPFLIEASFTAAECLLAIIVHRLEWLGHYNYMGEEERPLLALWWDNVKRKESFQKSTTGPNTSIQMMVKSILKLKLNYIYSLRSKTILPVIPFAVGILIMYAYKKFS